MGAGQIARKTRMLIEDKRPKEHLQHCHIRNVADKAQGTPCRNGSPSVLRLPCLSPTSPRLPNCFSKISMMQSYTSVLLSRHARCLSRADYDADYLKELDRRSQIVYGIDFKSDSK